MTSPTLLTDFVGSGLAANRPSSPNIPAGATAFWYSTDTAQLSVWNGSAWVIYSPGATTLPTVVQSKAIVSSGALQSITLTGAPSQSNLLVAIWFGSGLPGVGSGWNQLAPGDGTPPDFTECYYKVCGAGESATQTPLASATTGSMHVWEVKPGLGGLLNFGHSTATTLAVSITPPRTALILGAVERTSGTELPNSVTNSDALDAQATDGTANRSVQGWHKNSQAASSTTYTANYTTSAAHQMGVICVV